MTKRVALAYSGGLDTSVAVAWLRIEHGYEVVAVSSRRRPGRRLRRFDASGRQLRAPSRSLSWTPARSCWPTSPCPRWPPTRSTRVVTRSSRRCRRPVIVRHLVAAARQHGATAVAHGATGKGNDQVRFEVGDTGARPGPRDLGAGARLGNEPRTDDRLRRQAQHRRHREQGQDLLDRRQPLGHGRSSAASSRTRGRRRLRTSSLSTVPVATEPVEVTIGFDHGVPVSLDGAELGLVELVEKLGQLAGSVGLRARRHRRGAPGRDKEPRGLRVPGRPRADHGAR